MLADLLNQFWRWAGCGSTEFASDERRIPEEPFYFPQFNEMMELAMRLINRELTDVEAENFLTCLALDYEEERLLDACKRHGSMEFIERIISVGIHHSQPNARWQLAELLRCRNVPSRNEFLLKLMHDSNAYVRKRAENAIFYLKDNP